MPVLIIVIPLIIRHVVAVTLVTGLAQHRRLLMVLTRVQALVRGELLLVLLTSAVVVLVAQSRVVGSIFLVGLGGGIGMGATARI